MVSRFTSLIFCVAMLLSIATRPVHAGMPFTNYVWFEATGLNPSSDVIVQGAQGVDLELSCDTSSGAVTCEWDIAMRMHSTQQLASMATNLLGNTQKHAITNLMHGGEFPSDGHLFTEVNSGGTLVRMKEVNIPLQGPEYDPDAGGPGDYLLATMTLHTLKSQGDLTVDAISATVNELLWVSIREPGLPDEPTYVLFGDGPALDGEVQGGLADCIHVHNVPEPATAAMTLVAAALISPWRRRRH